MRSLLFSAALLAGAATGALGAEESYVPPDSMSEFGPATVQPGYVQFCEDYYAGACGPYARSDDRFELTTERFAALKEVNQAVNRHVTPITDRQLWGVEDHWSYPVQRDGQLYGDCEDYVLEKRRLLTEKGWPADALLITVVFDRNEGGHAVLTVATDQGDLVLDNLTSEILYWHETPYRFVKRQSEQDPRQWVSLRRGRPAAPEIPVAGSD